MGDEKKQQKQKKLLLPKGTLIHIKGLPFKIKEDTYIDGDINNYKLVFANKIDNI